MAACSAVVLAVVAAGLPLYVFPAAGDVPRADVIFIIGPPTPARIAQAERLRADGVADRILISVPTSGPERAEKIALCQEDGVTCEHPLPFTTKGEAALLDRYSAARGLSSAVVLTYTPHVARTRYIFGRCSSSAVTVDPVDQGLDVADWAYQYLYQTAAFVKAFITPCAGADARSE